MALFSSSTLPTWLRVVTGLGVGLLLFFRGDIISQDAVHEDTAREDSSGVSTSESDFRYIVPPRASRTSETILSAGFVVTPDVFNSELMAPYDILHHTIFRDQERYIEPFIVSETGEMIVTFEGIAVQPHYSFDTAPPIDILVIPSTDGSMARDLENEHYMAWLTRAIEQAKFVITLCDGAFPLAETGALDGLRATTFPGDRDRFALRYPDIDVLYDARFVHDGKFITSVGGGMSYEPALYLTEILYGEEAADATAMGLVWDWDLQDVPHYIASLE